MPIVTIQQEENGRMYSNNHKTEIFAPSKEPNVRELSCAGVDTSLLVEGPVSQLDRVVYARHGYSYRDAIPYCLRLALSLP